jgi:hypothetical protein
MTKEFLAEELHIEQSRIRHHLIQLIIIAREELKRTAETTSDLLKGIIYS